MTHTLFTIGINMSRQTGSILIVATMLFSTVFPAHATPPPPPAAKQLRQAHMNVTVELVEAKNGRIYKITKLCTVSGKIPVYADPGRPASFNVAELSGCTMSWKGQTLDVAVMGAMAVAHDRGTFATAEVSLVPPGAVPLCPDLCGPHPLARSSADIRTGGSAKSLRFHLHPDPVSVLNASPTVWFDAEVAIID